MKPFLKSTPHSPLLFHHENTTEKYHFSNNSARIYLHVCVLNFSSLFSFFPQKMQLGVICLETWGSTQPDVAFWTFKFHSCCFVYSRTHPAPSSLPFHRPMFAVSCVKSVYLVHGWDLSFVPCGLSSRNPPHLLY